ncbi:ATP-binding protein [Actinokineospora sp. G85]|uniref:ATP-binding protein n=1 Tax=Actinokineospora sp. G85 TaxID=3406626 RepID=UPI003C7200D2
MGPLIGRAEVVEELLALVGAQEDGGPATPLITLSGAAGIGKTRVAHELVAHAAAQGRRTAFACLGEVDPARATGDLGPLARVVLDALGVADGSASEVVDVLAAHLAEASGVRPLIVLDNCERLKDEVARLVAVLLHASRSVQVLITCRGEIGLPSERVFPVPALPMPRADAGRDDGSPALALLLHLLTTKSVPVADDQWDALLELVRWSGGLPLVLVQIAARLRGGLPPATVLERMDRGRLLGGGRGRVAQTRNRTLAQTLSVSYEDCSAKERLLFARLAVFAGGAEVDLIEEVCADDRVDEAEVIDLLAGLVAVELLIADGSGRFRMHNPMREYALQRLNDLGDEERVRDAHLARFSALAQDAGDHWLTPGPADRVEQEWQRVLCAEIDNLRAAMTWSMTRGRPRVGLAIAVNLARARFWWLSGRLDEGSSWLDRLTRACRDQPDLLVLNATGIRGWMLLCQGAPDTAAEVRDSCAALVETLGLSDDPPPVVDFLTGAYLFLAEADTASLDHLRRAARKLTAAWDAGQPVFGDRHQVVLVLGLAAGLLGGGQRATAAAADQVLAEARAGRAELARAWGLWVRGTIPLDHGDPAHALAEFQACLRVQVELGDSWGAAWATLGVVWALARLGAAEQAVRLHGGATRLQEGVGSRVEGLAPFKALTRAALDGIRTHIGPNLFTTYHESGRELSDEDVYAQAQQPPKPARRAAASRKPVARDAEAGWDDLTPAQRRVAQLVARDKRNADIAGQLGIALRTVESHITAILRTLGMTDRKQVREWARAYGFGDAQAEPSGES